ncbi:MAG: carbohydrate ABC transporter permease [Methanomassiliicoccales archaeon]|nr:carbohydrate ABC transporter permease [Methanomassiliicoccales archaeon]
MIYLGVSVLCMWILAPLVWTALTSVQSYANLTSVPPKISFREFEVYYYRWLFTDELFRRAIIQSVLCVTCATFFATILAAMGAYIIGVYRIRMRTLFLFSLLFIQLIPALALLIPLFILLKMLNLVDTFWGLVLTFLLFQTPVAIWILRGFFEAIPHDIFDAAKIDGCSRLVMFRKIAWPLARPGITATALYTFITGWGDLLIPLTVGIYRWQLLTVYASAFGGLYQIDYGGATAVATLTAVPTIVLAVVFHRKLLQGLTAGAIKG